MCRLRSQNALGPLSIPRTRGARRNEARGVRLEQVGMGLRGARGHTPFHKSKKINGLVSLPFGASNTAPHPGPRALDEGNAMNNIEARSQPAEIQCSHLPVRCAPAELGSISIEFVVVSSMLPHQRCASAHAQEPSRDEQPLERRAARSHPHVPAG